MKIFLIAGARPNFMKIAPLLRQLKAKRKAEDERLKCQGLRASEPQRSEVSGSDGKAQTAE
ncbi:MAG: hypothetical protein LUQ59_12455, partial [Methanothrix sp.]|nr:hypothetical protein [Methanothrix sp.]